ncbi:MAG: exopolysaccharide biosynthesis polyprenyl glycosylphosphotransferase [Treponema sp.]|nr:exopolysaccharide biosynthesis polyprenyl glycosylphosphotransferase [Treponema sp.]
MDFEELNKYLKKTYPRTSSFFCGFSLFIVDALILFLSIGFGFFIINIINTSFINFKSFIRYTAYIPFILILYAANGLYPGIMNSPTEDIKHYFSCNFFSFIAIILSIYISEKTNTSSEFINFIVMDSKEWGIVAAFGITLPIVTIGLPAFREFAKHFFSSFKWWGVPAVIYVDGTESFFLIDRLLKMKHLGYHPAIIIDSSAKEIGSYKNIPIYPPSEELHSFIKQYNIKQAIICNYQGDMSVIMSSYRYTINVSKNQTLFTDTQQLKDIGGIIGFSSIHNLTFKRNLFFKRLIDILSILIFLPIIAPVMLILAILTKCTSKGPIFYGHKRVGKNGKEIKCWKFRSMCVNSQEILEQILATDPVRRAEWEKDRKFVDDPRVTKFGKFLRKTSLDELPQLFNILIGQMSLVGPRPVTEPELEKYGKYTDYVLSVTPGLTGMWQVSGRSDTGYEERIAFDTYYIQNWSVWLDIWILIKTVWVVFKGKGAY